MIGMFHSTVARLRAFVRRVIARVCAFYRAATVRVRATFVVIVRFLGG